MSTRGGERLEGLLSLRVVCIRSGLLFEEHEVALSGAVVRRFLAQKIGRLSVFGLENLPPQRFRLKKLAALTFSA